MLSKAALLGPLETSFFMIHTLLLTYAPAVRLVAHRQAHVLSEELGTYQLHLW